MNRRRTEIHTPTLVDILWVLAAILAWALACGLTGCAQYDEVFNPERTVAAPTLPHPTTVWVNFADGTPTPAADDGCGGVLQPPVVCDASCRGLMLFELQQLFGDFAVSFVVAHPQGTDYLGLIITGGTSEQCGTGGDYGGIAPVLCGAGEHASGYVYAQPGVTVEWMAGTGAHEVGHMLGLVHVAGADIMNPDAVGSSFGTGAVYDNPTCAGGTTQDEPALLVERVGYR